MSIDTWQEIDQFFGTLYRYSEGKMEIRILPNVKRFFTELDTRKIWQIVKQHPKSNLYFGVATRNGHGGEKENIVNIPAVWTDIDYKDVPKSKVTEIYKRFQAKPSLIIASGGGLHFYWILKEPALKHEIPQIETINKQLATHFSGDLNATDAARILRIPGTLNYKYDPPRHITLAEANKEEYSLEDIVYWLPKDKDIYTNKERNTYTNILASISTPPSLEGVKLSDLVEMIDHDGRNAMLIRIGGYFRHLAKGEIELLKILHFFNQNFKEPLSEKELYPMWRGLTGYQQADEKKFDKTILEICQTPSKLAEVVKVVKLLGISANYLQVAKILERAVKAGLVMKPRYGYYQTIAEFATGKISQLHTSGEPVNFDMPLGISEFCYIYPNSLILLASKEGKGKTHVFAEWVRYFLEQKQPVAYWDMENEAPFIKKVFGKFIPRDLLESELFTINLEDVDIETLKIAEAKINFIDPIYVEGEHGWARIADIMRRLKKQLRGGLCVIAGHLKDAKDSSQLGEALGGVSARKVPSLILYLKHKKDRFSPSFVVKKVRHWKPGKLVREIECTWNDETGLDFLRYL